MHHDISVLPNTFEAVQNHVNRCRQEVASAFTYVLAMACGSRHSDEIDFEVEDYAWMNARVLPANRNVSENIVWLWVYTFMIINSNADIARLRGSEKQLSKRTILKTAIDLGQYLLVVVTKKDEPQMIDKDPDCTQNIVRRTWICINSLAQLHAIGTGLDDITGLSHSEDLALATDCRTLLSEPTLLLAGEYGLILSRAAESYFALDEQLISEISSI